MITVKTMAKIFEFLNDDREYVFPSTPGNLKSGAWLPIANVLWSAEKALLEIVKPRNRNTKIKNELNRCLTELEFYK